MVVRDDTRRVRVRAPGKINLFLRVGALREDGYHEVATAYQAVSLYEEVVAEPAEGFSVEFRGPIDTRGLATDDTNLAIRAAQMLARAAHTKQGVRLTITKEVPIAGGMGGGSADAAATLIACDTLWNTGIEREALLGLAARLGADVPFALLGGVAVGTGRGDELNPALVSGRFHWVLALPETGLSTPEVYGELDRYRESFGKAALFRHDRLRIDASLLQALRAGDPGRLAEALHNDLQSAAVRLQPHLVPLLEAGEGAGALAGIVSGSGPTLAFLVADAESAIPVAEALGREGVRTQTVSGPVHGARLVLS